VIQKALSAKGLATVEDHSISAPFAAEIAITQSLRYDPFAFLAMPENLLAVINKR
jgi:hypothetical protein